ncbi:ATP-binding cassette domain-containing protein [Vibrio splendidus]
MIEVENLCKSYFINNNGLSLFKSMFKKDSKEIVALEDINFSVSKGEAVGVIGLNGAGKSTLIKVLTGALSMSKGDVRVDGKSPFNERKNYVKNIGVVFGQRSQLSWDIPILSSYKLLQGVYDIPKEIFSRNLDEYSKEFGVEPFMHRPLRQLSLGQRVRAEIVAALLHSPSILFLDEPTIGLDLKVKQKIRDALYRLKNDKGVTIIITSHDFEDIDSLASRIILLHQSRIAYDGEKSNFLKKYQKEKSILFDANIASSEIKCITSHLLVENVEINNNRFKINVKEENVNSVVIDLINKYKLSDLVIEDNKFEFVVDSFINSLEK